MDLNRPNGEPRPAAVRVTIDSLTLTGLDVNPHALTDAFRTELTRLLRAEGVPPEAPPQRARACGGDPLPATTSARRLGHALARAVHQSLTGAPEGERGRARP